MLKHEQIYRKKTVVLIKVGFREIPVTGTNEQIEAIKVTDKNNSIISTSNYIHASSTCLCFDFITNLFEPKFYIKVIEKEELPTKIGRVSRKPVPRPQGYTTFFILDSTEHKISNAHKN